VKAEGAVADRAELAVEAFVAPIVRPRRMAARIPSRWLRRVRASRTNGRRRERAAPASQASRCAGARSGSGQVVEQPEFFAQQEGAVAVAVAEASSTLTRSVAPPASGLPMPMRPPASSFGGSGRRDHAELCPYGG